METLHVAIHAILAGEHLKEGDAFEHVADAAKSRANLRGLEVMQHVRAHDDVETMIEAQILKLTKPGQPDIAATPVALNGVLARLQPLIMNTGPELQ